LARTSRWQREGQGFKSPRVHRVKLGCAFFIERSRFGEVVEFDSTQR